MSGSSNQEQPPWEQPRRGPEQPGPMPPAYPQVPVPPGSYVQPGYGQNPLYQQPGYGQAYPPAQGQPYAGGYPPGYGQMYAQPFGSMVPHSWVKPHRGVVVIVLAVCSIAVCAVCGVIAFFMARADLEEMRQGIMDPSGEQITRVGYWVSLVHICLMGFLILFYVGLFMVMAVVKP